jgi:hypothetical protein
MKADGSPKLSGNYLNNLRIPDSGCFLKKVRCALLLKVFKEFSSRFFYSVSDISYLFSFPLVLLDKLGRESENV